MNILCIGNSFSEDASRYVHQIARADGVKLNIFNLYIGGCSLEKHFRNMMSDAKDYELSANGFNTNFKVTLKEGLLNRSWDVVSLQQFSGQSVNYETFQPYLSELSAYVKKCVPKAKQIVHQTWAYEEGCERLHNLGYEKRADMFEELEVAYNKAAKDIGAEMIIPSGELFQRLISEGITELHRDTFHASLGLGRYALGLLWYKKLTSKSVINNTFADFDEEISPEIVAKIKECVEKM